MLAGYLHAGRKEEGKMDSPFLKEPNRQIHFRSTRLFYHDNFHSGETL